jgi:DNA-binding CsgD family transcriptional regulator
MPRPPKWSTISKEQIESLARLGCTDEEIADCFGIAPRTVTRHFREPLHKGRAMLKTRIRRAQLKAADSGNVSMLVWLGKQLLGQADKQDTSDNNAYPSLTDTELAELARRRGLASPHWSRHLEEPRKPEPIHPLLDHSNPDPLSLKPVA